MNEVLGPWCRAEDRAGGDATRALAQRRGWLRRMRRRALAQRTAWLRPARRRKSLRTRLLGLGRSLSPALVVAASAFLLGVHDAYAVDLSSGFTEAGNKYKSYVKQGIALAGLLCTVISLGMGGFKFMNKDPGAVWYVLGVVGGAVLFGVAQGVMS